MLAGNVLQYTQLASVLVGAGQLGEAEALLHQLLLHVEAVKVSMLHTMQSLSYHQHPKPRQHHMHLMP